MKRNSLRNALATLLLLSCAALAQEIPDPEPAEPAVHTAVPPVLVRDVRVQSIGDERDLEALPPGLLFLDAETGRLMVADDDNPHGHLVCACRDIDWHSLTNDLKVNGHRILLNDAFSLQAEGVAVSLRHGTNSLLQILAADYGSLAPLTAALEDATHLLLTANAPADAILQTTTNLLDPAGWHAPDNAVVAGTTDAAITWRITLLDGTVPEFFRVLATTTRPAGIHANAPLHANGGIIIPEGQGLTMGTNTWTNLPDTNAFLTAETDAAALAALAAHTSATNPHGITAAGIGALTEESDPVALAALAPVETRVGALEERAEEYWCKWRPQDLSLTETNWIPTHWPAKTVWCFVNMTDTNATCVFALPNWSPEEDCTLHLVLQKASNVPGFFVRTVDGSSVANTSSSSAVYRDVVFSWRADIENWLVAQYTLSTSAYYIRGAARGSTPYSNLPNDEFLPVIVPAAQSLSSAPAQLQTGSLSPLSPVALQEDLDDLDAPAADLPDDSTF